MRERERESEREREGGDGEGREVRNEKEELNCSQNVQRLARKNAILYNYSTRYQKLRMQLTCIFVQTIHMYQKNANNLERHVDTKILSPNERDIPVV